ncbi:MAG: glycerophosphodiester phosphodiesterase family protein [bacterium]|nr:glycerophosphodiester phosphodiesterase [Gammaproteobacteria bacterium]HIL96856.1 glycerophosphodiester phosphodiesterase [Pseudomonadales bacterium]
MTQSTFLCIGHRGASGHAPENTLKAFEIAVDMNCPWVELDVYAVETELLVIHDDKLERTTNGTGMVMDANLGYLRSLDAGQGQQIPTLNEVIQTVDHRAGINIELKGPDTAEPVNQLLLELTRSGWQNEEFLISSFNHRELARADPRYRRGALFHRKVKDYFSVTDRLAAYAINLSMKIVDQETVTQAHQRGLKVYVYTVNKKKDMQALKSMGADGVFTNFPDRFPWEEDHNVTSC